MHRNRTFRWIAAVALLGAPLPLLFVYLFVLGEPSRGSLGPAVWLTVWALPFAGLAALPLSDRWRIGLGALYAPVFLGGMFLIGFAWDCGHHNSCF